MNGEHIECGRCSGYGLISDWNGEPDECHNCGGVGHLWKYPKGAIARYYSGPLIGKLNAAELAAQERAK